MRSSPSDSSKTRKLIVTIICISNKPRGRASLQHSLHLERLPPEVGTPDDTAVGIVGVLTGDVDGSWVG
jgi:hypothetical protein